jgi:hypothetical protein
MRRGITIFALLSALLAVGYREQMGGPSRDADVLRSSARQAVEDLVSPWRLFCYAGAIKGLKTILIE